MQYTITAADTGQTPYTGVTVTDDLTSVLDDAAYNGDAAATTGAVAYASPALTWTGDLSPGDTAIITYSVTVDNPDKGNTILTSTVTSAAPGSTCPASGTGGSECDSTVSIVAGSVSIAAPDALTWTAILDGRNQAVVDTNSADMTYSVSDFSGAGAGWTVTAEATPFTVGAAGPALPSTGILYTNGDPSDESSEMAPTSACVSNSNCIPAAPTGTVAYPVEIPISASGTATPAVIYDAAPDSGTGAIVIGNVGWWLNVPASAQGGIYTSMITLNISSEP